LHTTATLLEILEILAAATGEGVVAAWCNGNRVTVPSRSADQVVHAANDCWRESRGCQIEKLSIVSE
jgi:hypothetical protein